MSKLKTRRRVEKLNPSLIVGSRFGGESLFAGFHNAAVGEKWNCLCIVMAKSAINKERRDKAIEIRIIVNENTDSRKVTTLPNCLICLSTSVLPLFFYILNLSTSINRNCLA